MLILTRRHVAQHPLETGVLLAAGGGSDEGDETGVHRLRSTCLRISQPLYFLYTWNSGVKRFGGFDTCAWLLCLFRLG